MDLSSYAPFGTSVASAISAQLSRSKLLTGLRDEQRVVTVSLCVTCFAIAKAPAIASQGHRFGADEITTCEWHRWFLKRNETTIWVIAEKYDGRIAARISEKLTPTLSGGCMKAHWIIVPAGALIFMSAGLALTSEPRVTKALATQTNQALAPEALAKKSGCLECHSVDKKVVGPSYHDIAEKYKGDAGARSALIEKVRKGGKGNWTAITNEVPMPPFGRRLSATDITRLVDWVLSLKDSETK